MSRFWKSAETAVRASGMAFGMLAPVGVVIGTAVGAFMGGVPGAIAGGILGAPAALGILLLHLPLANLCVRLDRVFNANEPDVVAARMAKPDNQSFFPLKRLTKSFKEADKAPAHEAAPPSPKKAPHP